MVNYGNSKALVAVDQNTASLSSGIPSTAHVPSMLRMLERPMNAAGNRNLAPAPPQNAWGIAGTVLAG